MVEGGGYSVFQLEKSKFVKKKVEETMSFVPGEKKEAVGGGGGRAAAVSSSGSCPA